MVDLSAGFGLGYFVGDKLLELCVLPEGEGLGGEEEVGTVVGGEGGEVFGGLGGLLAATGLDRGVGGGELVAGEGWYRVL